MNLNVKTILYKTALFHRQSQNSDWLIKLFFLVAAFTLLNLSFQYLLVSDSLYYNALGDQLSYESIQRLIDQGERWRWLGNALVPIIYTIKLMLVTGAIALGSYLATTQFHFKRFFRVAIFAELIFLLPLLVKLIWFLFLQTDYTLQDLSTFYPLSLLNITGTENIRPYWLYPLQTLNLFEVGYWMLLAQGVSEATEQSLRRALGLVMSSYGVGLLLWVVLIMFLTITLT